MAVLGAVDAHHLRAGPGRVARLPGARRADGAGRAAGAARRRPGVRHPRAGALGDAGAHRHHRRATVREGVAPGDAGAAPPHPPPPRIGDRGAAAGSLGPVVGGAPAPDRAHGSMPRRALDTSRVAESSPSAPRTSRTAPAPRSPGCSRPVGVPAPRAARPGRAARCSPQRRRQVERNLRRVHGPAFGGAELRRAVTATFDSYGRYFYELFRLPDESAEWIEAHVRCLGIEHVAAAVADGTGAVLALPHLGNWDFAGAWLALQGYRVTVVAEPVEPPELFEWFVETRAASGDAGGAAVAVGRHRGAAGRARQRGGVPALRTATSPATASRSSSSASARRCRAGRRCWRCAAAPRCSPPAATSAPTAATRRTSSNRSRSSAAAGCATTSRGSPRPSRTVSRTSSGSRPPTGTCCNPTGRATARAPDADPRAPGNGMICTGWGGKPGAELRVMLSCPYSLSLFGGRPGAGARAGPGAARARGRRPDRRAVRRPAAGARDHHRRAQHPGAEQRFGGADRHRSGRRPPHPRGAAHVRARRAAPPRAAVARSQPRGAGGHHHPGRRHLPLRPGRAQRLVRDVPPRACGR